MNSNNFKKIIFDKLTVLLKTLSFKRSGNTFQTSNGELTYYINLQASKSSTVETLKFTLNIEITSATLYKLEDTSLRERDRRHFIKRIGDYLDQPVDTWYTVSNSREAEVTAGEVIRILETHVLPEFSRIQTTNDLADLLRKNQCPGLTELQRKKYLSLLKQSI